MDIKPPDFLQVMKIKNHKDIYLQSERDKWNFRGTMKKEGLEPLTEHIEEKTRGDESNLLYKIVGDDKTTKRTGSKEPKVT